MQGASSKGFVGCGEVRLSSGEGGRSEKKGEKGVSVLAFSARRRNSLGPVELEAYEIHSCKSCLELDSASIVLTERTRRT